MSTSQAVKQTGPEQAKLMKTALSIPRVGDVFHEMYSFGVEVVAVGPMYVGWRSFNVATVAEGLTARTEWPAQFEMGGKFTGMRLHYRGDR